MVHLRKHRFPTGDYHKLQAKKVGPFRIKQKINDNSYVIDLPPHWKIASTFNVADIHDYHPPDDVPSVSHQLEDEFPLSGED